MLVAVIIVAIGASAARAAGPPVPPPPACAPSNNPGTPATAGPGNPCWTDVTPYPFGEDGNPVPANIGASKCPDATNVGSCYLVVSSWAFRAWNRGLAAVYSGDSFFELTTPYGLWRYNGTRWYPDPTFPGQTVCPGDKVLWAGKLDYWLIGYTQVLGTFSGSPALCRFDGVNDQWEPLAVPPATVAEYGGGTAISTGRVTMNGGACFKWNNCWFFGTGGAVVHWDGQSLSNVSTGLGSSPWLGANYEDAIAGTDAQGTPFAFAVGDSGAGLQPDRPPAPQIYSSTGGGFSPAAFSPPAGTDLDAIAFDSQGDGWIAGRPHFGSASGPLLPVASNGTPGPCPPITLTGAFYRWASIGVMPGGDAIAGGAVNVTAGSSIIQPVVAQVSCNQPPQAESLLVPDPAGSAGMVSQVGAKITAVAASASNDAWAASTTWQASNGFDQPPHLYQFWDGLAPNAPAGDDVEPRPVVLTPEPTIFAFAPPVVIPPPPSPNTVVRRPPAKHRRVRLKSAVYDIARPKVARVSQGTYTVTITFRVRRKVTIGLEAIRHGRVVSSSGLRTFTGKWGTLVVKVDPKAWPTGLKFVQPKTKRK